MDSIDVTAAVIVRDGRYLLCRRPNHKRHGGLWEFPGGKIEDGETYAEAVSRELQEELGVEASEIGEPIWETQDEGSPFRIIFLPVDIRGEPQALEHSEIAWVSLQDFETHTLAPSDFAFVRESLIRPV